MPAKDIMRKLTLNKETLVELTTGELGSVVGGATIGNLCGPTLTLTCWSEIDGCVTAQICAV
ncbi:MAG TPA: class I lanthipeptide [Frankiaceae bacterium]|nr:class I lanthipeptide [Frankiaceae bacterium]